MDGLRAGTKLHDPDSGVEAIVVKPSREPGLELRSGVTSSLVLSKRYACATCNAEVLVTKGGSADLVCHGMAMAMTQPKTLPASD
jgi:hypothetical protein